MTTIAVNLDELVDLEEYLAETGTELSCTVHVIKQDTSWLHQLGNSVHSPHASRIFSSLGDIDQHLVALSSANGLVAQYQGIRDEVKALRKDLERACSDQGDGQSFAGKVWNSVSSKAESIKDGTIVIASTTAHSISKFHRQSISARKKIERYVEHKSEEFLAGTAFAANKGLRYSRQAYQKLHSTRQHYQRQASKKIAVGISHAGNLRPVPLLQTKQGYAVPKGTVRSQGANSLSNYLCFIDDEPEYVEIVKVSHNNEAPCYVVCIRGMDLHSRGVNDLSGAVTSVLTSRDVYTQSLKDAMLASIPPGAHVMIIGHSQGGAAAMNLANDKKLAGPNGRYQITHVMTLGSPADWKPNPPGISVLRIENSKDTVPRLDGDPNYRHPAKYKFSEGKNPHGISTYQTAVESKNFMASQQYRQFSPGLEQYFTGEAVEVSTYQLREKDSLTKRVD
jgi:hypothetical protein